MSEACEGYELYDYFVQFNGIIRSPNGKIICRIWEIEELQARIDELETAIKNYLLLEADKRLDEIASDEVLLEIAEGKLEKPTVYGLDGKKCDNPVTIRLEKGDG